MPIGVSAFSFVVEIGCHAPIILCTTLGGTDRDCCGPAAASQSTHSLRAACEAKGEPGAQKMLPPDWGLETAIYCWPVLCAPHARPGGRSVSTFPQQVLSHWRRPVT
mmetsp:Transcript_93806/g.165420  ORF Transcript_93806/g.165420 Transcript_93806/m.165420 type:complete len:107 (-) Transcript_93806:1524-1844(-)